MLKILALLILSTIFSNLIFAKEVELAYKFDKCGEYCLQIQASFIGDESGETIVVAPWETYNHLKDKNFKFQALKGDIIPVAISPPNFKLQHIPSIPISVEYEIYYRPDESPRVPVIQNEWFHLYALNALVFPHVSFEEKVQANFDFSKTPDSFNIFSDYSKSKQFNVHVPAENLLSMQFIGTTNIPKEIDIDNELGTIVLDNARWIAFNEGELASIVNYFIKVQKKAMGDKGYEPHYIIFLEQPSEAVNKSLVGLYTNNNFISLTFPNGAHEKRYKVIYGISHEIFHTWLGGKLSIPLALRAKYRWFYEGFTDYFGLKFAKESGYISQDEYTSLLNGNAEALCANSSGSMGRLDSGDKQQAQGHFLAIYFENFIKRKKLPDDLIVQFINDLIHSSGGYLNETVFWDKFHQYFDEDFYEIAKIVLENKSGFELPSIEGLELVKLHDESSGKKNEKQKYIYKSSIKVAQKT